MNAEAYEVIPQEINDLVPHSSTQYRTVTAGHKGTQKCPRRLRRLAQEQESAVESSNRTPNRTASTEGLAEHVHEVAPKKGEGRQPLTPTPTNWEEEEEGHTH